MEIPLIFLTFEQRNGILYLDIYLNIREGGDWDIRIQKTFKALSDENRRKILDLLKKGPMTAGEIGEHFPVSGATMSHHLSVLKEAGLILDDRQGKYISYELNTSVVDELIGWVSGLKGESYHE